MSKHFTILVDTCNQKDWVAKSLDSALNQDYDNFEVIVMEALSDDGTWEKLETYKRDNLKIFRNEVRKYQIENIYELTRLSRKGTICVSLDGDDWLPDMYVLSRLNEIYNDDVWMTYGTYVEYPFRDVSHIYCPYPSDVIERNTFREYRWLASHLRTYRRELFLKIKVEDFKIGEKWLDTAGDQAFQLPMLEMASERSRHIPDIMLVYNMANTSRDGYFNEARQIELSNYIRSKPKYKRIERL